MNTQEVMMIGAKALFHAGGQSLRYDTGSGGRKAELRSRDLEAVMFDLEAVMFDKAVIGRFRVVTKQSGGRFSHGSGRNAPPPDKSAIRKFIGCFVTEIRNIICKNKTSSKSLGITTAGAVASMATWVADSFHAPTPLATAIAASVLLTVMRAAKGTFCKMTEAEAARIFPKPKLAGASKRY